MGKAFKQVVIAAVEIVISYYLPGSYAWLAGALRAAGIATLVNVAITALTPVRRPGAPPLNVTLRGTVEYRHLIFGTRRAGGVLVFYGTSGAKNEFLWYVIAYAGHQCSAFSDFWLDERRITTGIIPSGGGGTIITSPWNSKVQILKHLGTSGQAVDSVLTGTFGVWDANHRLQGITYAVVGMLRDDTVFPDGPPQSASALIDGALMYDPRADSTNGGSGSQRASNPSTWVFSRDPVQHIRWLLTGGSVHNDIGTRLVLYGMKESDARIEDAYTIASSNICDQSVSGANAPPSGAQPRYRCDLEVNCGETRREIFAALLATMAGTLTYVKGKWRINAGAYDAPVHFLNELDLYGDLEVQDTIGHDTRYNAVAPIYVDAAKQWIQTTGIYRTDSGYETQDGGERINKELQLDGVTDVYQAQRLAEISLRQSRMMRSVKLVGALNLMKVAQHEVLQFSHTRYAWTNRVFRAKEKQLELTVEAGRVTILASREDSGVWADMLTADYDSGTSDTDVFQNDTPDPPTALTIIAFPQALRFQVTLPGYMPVGSWVELWEYTASTPFASATMIGMSKTNNIDLPKRDITSRYYWVRIRGKNGELSTTFPATTGQSGAADVVQTTDIANGGATDLYVTTVSSVDVFSTSNHPTTIASLSVTTFSFSVDIVLTVIGYVDLHAPSSQFPCYVDTYTVTAPSTSIGSQDLTVARNINTTDPDIRSTFAREKTVTVTGPGTLATYASGQAGIGSSISGATCLLTNVVFKAEVIKR